MSNYTREKENSITLFNGEKVEKKILILFGVRAFEQNGTAYIHVEDTARGLGFTQTQTKDGVEYTSIRWERIEGFLSELNFPPQVGENGNSHDYYIPENIFYRLCMKAKNSLAETFQAKVADEIIPELRRKGSYSLANPEAISRKQLALMVLEAETAKEEAEARALQAEAERDEAKRTKTQYQEGLASKMAARVGGLTNANRLLKAENAELKDRIGRGESWRTVSMMKDVWIKHFGHAPIWQKIKKFSETLPPEEQPKHDVEETITLPDGSSKSKMVYRYHMKAWGFYMQYENERLNNK